MGTKTGSDGAKSAPQKVPDKVQEMYLIWLKIISLSELKTHSDLSNTTGIQERGNV